MKKLVLAVVACLVAAPAFAADEKAMNKESKMEKKGEMRAGGEGASAMPNMPMPSKVTKEKEDKKELDAMYKSMEDTMHKGDVDAGASMVDFPVMMITDDSKGNAMATTWDKDMWTRTMTESMKGMSPEMMKNIKHDRKYDLLSDNLAVVTDTVTMTMNGKKTSHKMAELAIRKDGKWMVKSMVEGGWGDQMMKGTETHGAGSSGMGGASGGSMK